MRIILEKKGGYLYKRIFILILHWLFLMTAAHKRIQEIDLIKGVALLGIFLMNIDFISTSNIVDDWHTNFTNPFDFVAGKLKFLFLAQRFIGIFSLLFGLSVAIQLKNFTGNKQAFTRYYFRRTIFLAMLGVIQITFFFMGDVLLVYSILCLLLFLFLKLSNRVLILSAILIFFIPAVLDSVECFKSAIDGFSENIKNDYTSDMIKTIYQRGSLPEMMKARFIEFFYYDLTGLIWNRTALAMMILGFAIGRNDLHVNYNKYLRSIKIIFGVCFCFYAAFIIWFLWGNTQFSFGVNMLYHTHILISITTYVLLILFISRLQFLQKVNSLISNIGRMSLSNYLFQSITCSFIFTGYGFSLFSTTTPTHNLEIVLAIYVLQIILSYFYLKKFRVGPLELVSQKFSYK